MLEKAIAVACQAHKGQKDLAGEPYILHPLRVMLRMDTEFERVVAVLHDVIEDGHEDLFLKSNFPSEVITAVYALSRRKREAYEDYIKRLKTHEVARKVKFVDLDDNLDPKRAAKLKDDPRNAARRQKYLRAQEFLLNV